MQALDNYLDETHYNKLCNNNKIYYKNKKIIRNFTIFVYPNKENGNNDTFEFKINYHNLIVFTAGTILNDTIYIKKIILTPTIKIWVYRLMLI